MATSITFFPVGNGDMTLIGLGDKAGTTILIDCNIRAAADDPNDKTRDVAKDLRERLNPSTSDIRSIREAVTRSTHHLNGFVFLIAGTEAFPLGLFVKLYGVRGETAVVLDRE
jgi:hypothetical protein